MANIYQERLDGQYDGFVRGYEVDDKGVIVRSWTWVRNGNGGLINDEHAAKPFIGKTIESIKNAFRQSEEN